MVADLQDPGGAPAWIAVNGSRVEVAGWRWYPHRWAGGAFTTDYGQLRRLVPAQLCPARVSRNRALVCAWGAYVPAMGHRPPFLRFGEVALMAFVTRGHKPAPPLVPGFGQWAKNRYGFGFFPLMTVVTSRVVAALYRILLGIPAAVADVRVERRIDRERFVCEEDGRLVWDLTVRSDGRPAAQDPDGRDWFYAVDDGEVCRVPVGGSGVSRSRYGSKAASLVVGDHPSADVVRRLHLSRAWAGEFSPDRQMWLAGPPETLGPASTEIDPLALSGASHARLVVSPQPGVEVEVDQGLDRFGRGADATVTGPGLQDRAR